MRTRPEAFGGVVSIGADDGSTSALVFVNRAMAKKLGVREGSLWQGEDPGLGVGVLSAPTEVHVAVTERCPIGCEGCYIDAKPNGHDPSLQTLKARLDELAALGVFRVAFGGGEPLLRDDIGDLGRYALSIGLEPTLTTSGIGLSPARAQDLRGFVQVNVSHDGVDDAYARVRGVEGAESAVAAMRALRDAAVPFGVNLVLTRETFDSLPKTFRFVSDLGARELQLLRFKPAGRGAGVYDDKKLTAAQVLSFPRRLRDLVSLGLPTNIRIDCAMVPYIAHDAELAPAAMALHGVMGCEAGRSLMTLDARGQAKPCSFCKDALTHLSRNAREAWDGEASLRAFRDYAATPAEPCNSCAFRTVCRGGCRIVAAHHGNAFAPDPECPRVMEWRGGDKEHIRVSRLPVVR